MAVITCNNFSITKRHPEKHFNNKLYKTALNKARDLIFFIL